MYKYFEKNEKGNDYVCGDIHGCYFELMENLVDIGFDNDKDRLFCCGDLVDRGTENIQCMSLLSEPWFFSVKGNHDEMFLNHYFNDDSYLWCINGGDWLEQEQSEYGYSNVHVRACAALMAALPLAIEVERKDGKHVGITHAEPPEDWNHVRDCTPCKYWNENKLAERLLWSRSKITHKETDVVKNIDFTVHGHTPVDDPVVLGNSIYIDTGLCFNGVPNLRGGTYEGKLTMLNIEDL